MKQWDFEGDYVMQFDANFRGIIGHKFCQAVREGCDDVGAILDYVRRHSVKDGRPVWMSVAGTLETTEAWDFAQHMLDRESLPDDEKIRLKNESKADNTYVRAAMAKDVPTEKQLSYLKSCGYYEIPKTKLEASDLISNFKASRKLPPMQKPDDCPF